MQPSFPLVVVSILTFLFRELRLSNDVLLCRQMFVAMLDQIMGQSRNDPRKTFLQSRDVSIHISYTKTSVSFLALCRSKHRRVSIANERLLSVYRFWPSSRR